MGSKRTIAKDIINIMSQNLKKVDVYIEPFVGGANMIDKVPHKNKIGYDINKYVIAVLKAIRDGVNLPKKVTRKEYYKIKESWKNNNKDYPDYIKGYVGIVCAFGSKFFDSFANPSKCGRDYTKEAYRNAIKQTEKLKGIKFYCKDYRKIKLPKKKCLIYCDPPYRDMHNKKYRGSEIFNHDVFYSWCLSVKKEGHIVYVSERNKLPKPFKKVWSKDKRIAIKNNENHKTHNEKLFKL